MLILNHSAKGYVLRGQAHLCSLGDSPRSLRLMTLPPPAHWRVPRRQLSQQQPEYKEKSQSKPDIKAFIKRVTNQIIEAMERGAGDWNMPWHQTAAEIFVPINVQSKKRCTRARKPGGLGASAFHARLKTTISSSWGIREAVNPPLFGDS